MDRSSLNCYSKRAIEYLGLARRESWYRPNNASHLADRIEILFGDMAEGVDIALAIQNSKPDETYNLASQSAPANHGREHQRRF